MRFSSTYIDRSDNGFNIHQRSYIDFVKPLPSDANSALLRQQVSENSLNMSHVKQYNTTVQHLQDTRHLSLRMCKLDPENLHVRTYKDASFSINCAHSSELCYIISLADKHSFAPFRYKSRRVARSVLSAERYAFVDASDFACCAKTDLEKLLDRRVSLSIFTDSKSLFYIIMKCSQTQERRLMIGL